MSAIFVARLYQVVINATLLPLAITARKAFNLAVATLVFARPIPAVRCVPTPLPVDSAHQATT